MGHWVWQEMARYVQLCDLGAIIAARVDNVSLHHSDWVVHVVASHAANLSNDKVGVGEGGVGEAVSEGEGGCHLVGGVPAVAHQQLLCVVSLRG